MIDWRPYAAVGAGSALGSSLRFAVSAGTLSLTTGPFPWATLLVNTLGSFLIGWLYARALASFNSPLTRWQPFLVAGFCGGFTTFSLFSMEVLQLLTLNQPGMALTYLLLSLPLWMLAVVTGFQLGDSRAVP